MDEDFPPDRHSFRQVGNWCQEYLELQQSREVGQAFGQIVKILGEIAAQPRDGVDRFDWLLQREHEVTRLLGELAENCHSQPRTTSAVGRVLLFVYGTLKRGYQRAPALEHQRFVGVATTRPEYRIFDCGGYPGLVETDDGQMIEGELWEVDGTCLERLDEMEGVSYRLYARRPIRLEKPHDGTPAESYFYLRSTAGLADCGTSWPGRA